MMFHQRTLPMCQLHALRHLRVITPGHLVTVHAETARKCGKKLERNYSSTENSEAGSYSSHLSALGSTAIL